MMSTSRSTTCWRAARGDTTGVNRGCDYATSAHAMRRKANRRGVALLLVLWLVALLAMVTIAASGAARGTGDLVVARRASATARSMAESGITSAFVTIEDSLRAMLGDSLRRDAFLNDLDAGVNGG